MQAASPAWDLARTFWIAWGRVSLLKRIAVCLTGNLCYWDFLLPWYNSLKRTKYDLAILRALGATRFQLWFWFLWKVFCMTCFGAFLELDWGHWISSTADQLERAFYCWDTSLDIPSRRGLDSCLRTASRFFCMPSIPAWTRIIKTSIAATYQSLISFKKYNFVIWNDLKSPVWT